MVLAVILHIPLLVFGAISNVILMIAVLCGTPPALKTYSILIFYSALNDLIDVVAFAMTSFERNRVLAEAIPNHRTIHFMVICVTAPNIAHLIASTNVKNASPSYIRESANIIYPGTNWTGAAFYGLSSGLESTIVYSCYFLITPTLLVALMLTRRRVLANLEKVYKIGKISSRLVELNRIFVKILTIHSLLPLAYVVAIAGFIPLTMQIHVEVANAVIYMGAMFSSCCSGAVTVWYLKPYKAYMRDSFIRFGAIRTLTVNTTVTRGDKLTN
ncbi:hypothetical protein PRIPAC_79214 [Pristionchus pacificus]|uniref:G protein-coupled receptor n=1 Tax=Pristionchus pacificus TaxID=54126 RepID=A0A2A6CKJ5_PRIPA|nr:hypothetical protein PRIPAC_79214 [Pristionchus pacificus]|eukprot:PDM78597.1 G protein-coupled receptor [Pristionchus pacificus]